MVTLIMTNPGCHRLKQSQGLEFFWRGRSTSLELADNYTIFTHILDSHYSTPPLAGTTAAERAASLLEVAKQRAQWYRTEHLLIPFGNDFYFTSVLDWVDMDGILNYIRANQSAAVCVAPPRAHSVKR